MEISEQIIKVLDNLAEKFGVIIDWSQENALPYIQDLSDRIVRYDIAKSCIWIILRLLFIFSGLLFITQQRRISIKNKKHTFLFDEDGDFRNEYYDDLQMLFIIFYVILSIFAFIFVVFNVFSIIQDIYLPEKLILDTIKSLN